MSRQWLKDGLGWGFLLWFIGYVLGIVFFMVLPVALIGWVIMPMATTLTLWVLMKKIKGGRFTDYLCLSIIWTCIAVIFDYLFIVKALKSADYYKLDVYLYYALMFALPLLVGWRKNLTLKEDTPSI